MKGTRPLFLALALGLMVSLAASGCASGGSGGGSSSTLRKDIGAVMEAPLLEAREKIFGKYSIPMLREEDTSRSIYWETQWMPREPTPEEVAEGVSESRNRIIIRGNFVDQRLDGSVVLRARFDVENQVRSQMNPGWHPGPMPSSVEDSFEEIYEDFRLELRTGVIR